MTTFEIGSIIAHRVWRYRLFPLTLMSFCLGDDRTWPKKKKWIEADKDPNWDCKNVAHGIHAFKTRAGLKEYFRQPADLLNYRDCSPPEARWDGIVIGTVELYGNIIEHKDHYRAQFARPASFDEVYNDTEALEQLREEFLHVV